MQQQLHASTGQFPLACKQGGVVERTNDSIISGPSVILHVKTDSWRSGRMGSTDLTVMNAVSVKTLGTSKHEQDIEIRVS